MSTVKQIDPEDLVLYAMQMLPAGQAEAVMTHLEQSASARNELAEIYGDLALLAMTAEAPAVSGGTRTRFLKQIAEEKQGSRRLGARQTTAEGSGGTTVTSIGVYQPNRGKAEVTNQGPRKAHPAAKVALWTGWAVAAGLAVAAGNLYHERQALRGEVAASQSTMANSSAEAATARAVLNAMNDQMAMRVTLTRQGTPPSPTGRTTYSSDKGVLIFTASNLEPIDTYKVYELWLIPANGSAPIAAGTFHPDAKGYANMVSTQMPKGIEAKAFGITVEDDGGSKVPTPPILMTGA